MSEVQRLELITAAALRSERHRGILTAGDAHMPCALGRTGVTDRKREGDGASPLGTWPLRYVLYRPDRGDPPSTGLEVRATSPMDGWCDCPSDGRYNRPVRLPYRASAESLWREDGLYDIVVVLGYNDAPPQAGLGSAIFLHLATPEFDPTAGCVAVCRADMVQLLIRCGPQTHLTICG